MDSVFFKEKYIKTNGDVVYELACPCCGINKVTIDAVSKLDAMRLHYGRPIYLNSAYRCPKHNASPGVSSKPTSSHLKGAAFDIRVSNSVDRLLLVDAALKAGFRRIGPANTFLHVDCDPDKPECLYLYP